MCHTDLDFHDHFDMQHNFFNSKTHLANLVAMINPIRKLKSIGHIYYISMNSELCGMYCQKSFETRTFYLITNKSTFQI